VSEQRVIIAGAGPVGMVAAARLVQAGIPVTVLEAGDGISRLSRASTFHPPTLDMLDDLGVASSLMEEGLVARNVQYRSKHDGLLGRFDFAEIADHTRHPFRLQCEQWRLCEILLEYLRCSPLFQMHFNSQVRSTFQNDRGAGVILADGTRQVGRWVIAADGASSAIRQYLGIPFEGFTWTERFLVLTTPEDLARRIPELDSVSYVSHPETWHSFLQIPGHWRVMFPVPVGIPDTEAFEDSFGEALLHGVLPELVDLEISHRTLYRVHQRAASTFQQGRIFLAGDAAHISNPLGGMGMNAGIHDAVNLTGWMISVWNEGAPEKELERYDLQRRRVTEEYIQTSTIQNKLDLEAATPQDQAIFRKTMEDRMADQASRREFLLGISMIKALDRAEQLG